MKLFYVTLLLALIASLLGLEILAARLPYESLRPARVGDSERALVRRL